MKKIVLIAIGILLLFIMLYSQSLPVIPTIDDNLDITPESCYLTGIEIRDGSPEYIVDGSWVTGYFYQSPEFSGLRFIGGPGKTGVLHFVFDKPYTLDSFKVKAWGDSTNNYGLILNTVTAQDNNDISLFTEIVDIGFYSVDHHTKIIDIPETDNVKQINIHFSVPRLYTLPGFAEIVFNPSD